ncbi:LPS export ABC transporter permease LptG [Entomobacter blattae]|uniref:Lipopolysaccharide export system permease protein LptG n=1 Tax=Entomobacter blattae TaxID=2762277 RepID=A0A7H1NV10_9PROT|nr:LPS export ABC transporter permease LptG [Entomobacter blattae]QNT79620.1 Lipopolysaccharide export system permease protein LptG [Entomobacter blattae]
MFKAVTLSLYIGRQFSLSAITMILSLTGLVSLFDFIDLLRRVATKPNVSSSIVTKIALLHIPHFSLEILPFGILLGGIICFWRLTRSSELVVARAAGISAWQFLAAPVVSAFLIGIFAITAISPISSIMFRKAEYLDQTYLRTGGGPLTFTGGELWVRQSDHELVPHGVAIMHAQQVKMDHGKLLISGVSLFRLDEKDILLLRMEAANGELGKKVWKLYNAHSLLPDHEPQYLGDISIPTDLTVTRVEDSFASPDTLSLWTLPGFIRLLERSGFSSIRHRLHFQSLLSLPLLASTMAFVAAGFSMRPSRRGGVMRMIGSGVAVGFALFAISKVTAQLGDSGTVPPFLAAWAPAAAGLCLALSLLLHLEDG